MIISPKLQKALVEHLEHYISMLENERSNGLENISPIAETIEYQILEAQTDLQALKSLG